MPTAQAVGMLINRKRKAPAFLPHSAEIGIAPGISKKQA